MASRVKLTVAYLGGSFRGWQRQPAGRTVQGELERALRELTGGRELTVVGAGRTDAGVHARGQVAHVDLPVPIPVNALLKGLNVRLPETIRVHDARLVGPPFHARFSARGKRYVYRARWADSRLPWSDMRAARMRPPLRGAELAAAVARLPGYRDMGSFSVPGPVADRAGRRHLFRASWQARPGGLDLEFVGDGFLRYQVRRMVGALFQVAWGQLALDDLDRLLEQPEPGASILTAPARGLSLEQVYYRRCDALKELCSRSLGGSEEDAGCVVDSKIGADDTQR